MGRRTDDQAPQGLAGVYRVGSTGLKPRKTEQNRRDIEAGVSHASISRRTAGSDCRRRPFHSVIHTYYPSPGSCLAGRWHAPSTQQHKCYPSPVLRTEARPSPPYPSAPYLPRLFRDPSSRSGPFIDVVARLTALLPTLPVCGFLNGIIIISRYDP